MGWAKSRLSIRGLGWRYSWSASHFSHRKTRTIKIRTAIKGDLLLKAISRIFPSVVVQRLEFTGRRILCQAAFPMGLNLTFMGGILKTSYSVNSGETTRLLKRVRLLRFALSWSLRRTSMCDSFPGICLRIRSEIPPGGWGHLSAGLTSVHFSLSL